MRRASVQITAAAALALALAAIGGCAAPLLVPAAAAAQTAGSGYSYWQGNKLKQAFPVPIGTMSKVLDLAIDDLALTIDDDDSKIVNEVLVQRVVRISDDDERLGTVRLERMTDEMTYVVMQSKLFGNRAAIQLVQEQIARSIELGAS